MNLPHRGTVQSRGTAQDAAGGPSSPWALLATIYMNVVPLNGRELLAAQAHMPEVTHEITTRYGPIWADPSAAAKYRIVWQGRMFNLGPSRNIGERNFEVRIFASEGLNDG